MTECKNEKMNKWWCKFIKNIRTLPKVRLVKKKRKKKRIGRK